MRRPIATNAATLAHFTESRIQMSSSHLPTERTPLINGTTESRNSRNESACIVQIEKALYNEEYLRDDTKHPSLQAIHDAVNSCNLPVSEKNDALVTLLCLRRIKAVYSEVHSGAPELTTADVPEYEAFAREELGKLLKPRMDAELDRMLWASFLVDEGKGTRQTGALCSRLSCDLL